MGSGTLPLPIPSHLVDFVLLNATEWHFCRFPNNIIME